MKTTMKIATILFMTLITAQAYAEKVITIDKSCVYLNELTAPSVPANEVACLAPGEEKYFSKELIQNHLSRAGIKGTVLSGITVKREGEKVSNIEIINEVTKAYKAAHPDVDIEVEQIRMNKDVFSQTNGGLVVDIDTSKFGSNYAEVYNGVERTQLYVYIRAFKDGYVTAERLKAGDLIEGNVRLEKVDITNMRSMPLEDISGLVASKSMSYGRAITQDLVEQMPEIKKGDSVRIVYDNNGIKLETTGIAEENGYIGKTLTVRNVVSQRLVAGNYIGSGRVIVK